MAIQVTIGIQARTSSKRFPKKIFEKIGDKTVLDHCIDACDKSAKYINKFGTKGIEAKVVVCIPTNDYEIKNKFGSRALIFEGSEDDVLSRYFEMAEHFQSDYVVRITSDCPLIPSFVVTKCITTAVAGQYDYISNVDERCRTAPDGFDCEVISKKALKYLHGTASLKEDREHVTTFIRTKMPPFMKQGVIINFLDLSQMKLSLDTPEDLKNINAAYSKVDLAVDRALMVFGPHNVHRF